MQSIVIGAVGLVLIIMGVAIFLKCDKDIKDPNQPSDSSNVVLGVAGAALAGGGTLIVLMDIFVNINK